MQVGSIGFRLGLVRWTWGTGHGVSSARRPMARCNPSIDLLPSYHPLSSPLRPYSKLQVPRQAKTKTGVGSWLLALLDAAETGHSKTLPLPRGTDFKGKS